MSCSTYIIYYIHIFLLQQTFPVIQTPTRFGKPRHLPLEVIPKEFDWRDNANLINMVSQRSTATWCGSCWALSAATMISDRFRIKYRKEFGLRSVSPQVLLNCGYSTGVGSCLGGNLEKAMNFVIEQEGITDETCMPYVGLTSSFNTFKCQMCRTCTLDGTCKPVENPTKYNIGSWGMVSGEEQILSELYQRGPVACYIYSHSPEYTQYKGGIIEDPVPTQWAPYNYTHAVEVVGYGTDRATGKDYYTVRNWAGTAWGEEGFFRIKRGENSLNMEWRCIWADPIM